MGATTGHTLATGPCSLPSSSCIARVQAGIPRHCPWLQPHSSHSLTGVKSAGQNRSVQAGPGSVAQHSTAWHDAELVVSLGPSLLSSSAGPTSAGATTAVASGHGSMWWGHIYTSELQHAETGSTPSCPNHGALPGHPVQDGMGFAGRQQLDPATFWQHSRGWLPHTAQLPGLRPSSMPHCSPTLCQLLGGSAGQKGAATRPPTRYSSVLAHHSPGCPSLAPAQCSPQHFGAMRLTSGCSSELSGAEHCTVRDCGVSPTPGTY